MMAALLSLVAPEVVFMTTSSPDATSDDKVGIMTTLGFQLLFTTQSLGAPSHYLNQCWLIFKGVLWRPPEVENNFTRNVHEFNPYHVFGNCTFKIIATSPRNQWFERQIYHILIDSGFALDFWSVERSWDLIDRTCIWPTLINGT